MLLRVLSDLKDVVIGVVHVGVIFFLFLVLRFVGDMIRVIVLLIVEER